MFALALPAWLLLSVIYIALTGVTMAMATTLRNNFPVFSRYDTQHLARGSASRRASWTRMHRESNG